MQSVPITTKVVSSNPTHDDVYLIQHYVIRVVSDLRQVGAGFFFGYSGFPTNKTHRHDTTIILLILAFSTINQTRPNLISI